MSDAAPGLFEDLRAGRLVVRAPGHRVRILVGVPVAVGLRLEHEPDLADGAVGALERIGEQQLDAVGLQDRSAVLGNRAGDGERDLDPQARAQPRVGDAGVAGGRVEQDLVPGELAGLQGVLDDVEARAVLDRPAGIGPFRLGHDLDAVAELGKSEAHVEEGGVPDGDGLEIGGGYDGHDPSVIYLTKSVKYWDYPRLN